MKYNPRHLIYLLFRQIYRISMALFAPVFKKRQRLLVFLQRGREAFVELLNPVPPVEPAVEPEVDPREPIPEFILKELRTLHDIEPLLFPDATVRISIAQKTPLIGEHYICLRAAMRDSASHLLVICGEADHTAKGFIEAVREKAAGAVVINTGDSSSGVIASANVDVIEFGALCADLSPQDAQRLLARLILQLNPRVLHVTGSSLGFGMLESYGMALSSVIRIFVSVQPCSELSFEGRLRGDFLRLSSIWPALYGVFFDDAHWRQSMIELYAFDPGRLHMVCIDAPDGKGRKERFLKVLCEVGYMDSEHGISGDKAPTAIGLMPRGLCHGRTEVPLCGAAGPLVCPSEFTSIKAERGVYEQRLIDEPVLRETLSVFWADGVLNFGDYINSVLLQSFGIPSVIADAGSADLIGVGSILSLVPGSYKGIIMGAGFMWENNCRSFPLADCRLLRGRLTAQRCSAPKSTSFGDPGLLIGRFVGTPVETRYALGLVPHYVDADHPAIHKLLLRYPADITVIDVRQPVADVARAIAECSCIASSSLHGLIAADALGKPGMWLKLSDKVFGDGFKFRDYFSAFSSAEAIRNPMSITGDEELSTLIKSIPKPVSEVGEVIHRLEILFGDLSALIKKA